MLQQHAALRLLLSDKQLNVGLNRLKMWQTFMCGFIFLKGAPHCRHLSVCSAVGLRRCGESPRWPWGSNWQPRLTTQLRVSLHRQTERRRAASPPEDVNDAETHQRNTEKPAVIRLTYRFHKTTRGTSKNKVISWVGVYCSTASEWKNSCRIQTQLQCVCCAFIPKLRFYQNILIMCL